MIQVLEFEYKYDNKQAVINSIESSIALLNYAKPKPRSVIIPGEMDSFPDEIEGGLVKREQTPEGVLFSTDDGGPGFQIESSIYQDKSAVDLVSGIFNTIKQAHKDNTNEEFLPFYQHSWVFVNPPTEQINNYHNHLVFNNTFPYDVPTYTWVYYLQLPNNCEGDDGKLSFRDDNEIYNLDIQPDTIYVFPADLDHKANLSPLSTVNRITLAGNILIPGSEKSMISE